MRTILLWCCLMLSLAAGNAEAKGKHEGGDSQRRPMETKECVKKDAAGTCREWDTTFAVAGAECTENCLLFSAMDTCKVRNTCHFDAPSSCFKKKVCTHINAMDDCENWKSEPACH